MPVDVAFLGISFLSIWHTMHFFQSVNFARFSGKSVSSPLKVVCSLKVVLVSYDKYRKNSIETYPNTTNTDASNHIALYKLLIYLATISNV